MSVTLSGLGYALQPVTYVLADYITPFTPYNLATVIFSTGSDFTVNPGDVFRQGDLWANVVAVSGGTVFFDGVYPWSTSSGIEVYAGIPTHLEWNPDFGGDPGVRHHWREFNAMYKAADFTTLSSTFRTDLVPVDKVVTTTGLAQSLTSGTNDGRGRNIRTLIPLSAQRGSQLTVGIWHRDGWRPFQLQGTSLVYTDMSERTNK